MTVGGRPRVVVVGAINVDLIVCAERLPGPGETVVGDGPDTHGGGKGANAAVAAARAGAEVHLVGAVGGDPQGRATLDDLRDNGVEVGGVAELPATATGMALIVVDPHGENQIAVGAGANHALQADHVRAALEAALPGAGCVLVSTEIPDEAVTIAVERATAAGIPCVLNPAPVTTGALEALSHGPMLTPNALEILDLAAGLLGHRPTRSDTAQEVADAARLLIARTGAPVLVTLGGEGALAFSPGDDPRPIPPFPAVARDTTGAGDTFNGVLAVRLAAGEQLLQAARTAAAAAALSVGQFGARGGMPDWKAIEAAMQVA